MHRKLWVAVAAAALCLCAACPAAFAFAQDSDGSGSGAVVEAGSAADTRTTSKDAGKTDPVAADETEKEAGQGQEGAAQDQGTPKPLDAPDNVLNDGQVSDASFLYDAAIADLAGADSYYDGQTVRVTGEAVGEAMANVGDSRVWVTLLDAEKGASVVVSMRPSDAEKIDTYGSYKARGTILRVKGEYHLACPEHEGESDIHATTVSVVERGKAVVEEFHVEDFLPGFVLLTAGAALSLIYWRLRERAR